MRAADMFHPDYDLDVERAFGAFYGRSQCTESEFIDSCQLLIDTGVWLMDANIGETCLFLIESGNLLLPEEDQMTPDGEFIILGSSRKNVVN
jgi:hypothetical protein